MALDPNVQNLWACHYQAVEQLLNRCGVFGVSLSNIAILAGLIGITLLGVIGFLLKQLSTLTSRLMHARQPSQRPGTKIDNTPRASRHVVGRLSELHEIRETLAANRTAAVVGGAAVIRAQGGIGKTTVAEQYARTYGGEYAGIWFISAASINSIARGFYGLGKRLGVVRDKRVPLEDFVHETLTAALTRGAPWLLVYDNASQPSDLQRFLIDREGLHCLVTSRYSDWTNVAHAVDLSVLPDNEAVSLLAQEAQYSEKDFRKLAVDVLGCFPLAIVVAGGYLRQTKASVADYIRALQDHLRDTPLNDPYQNSVSGVVLETYEQLSANARALLSLLAYFPPDAISAALIITAVRARSDAQFWDSTPATLRHVISSETMLRETLAEIARYSLITEIEVRDTSDVADQSFTMHRLTQLVLRNIELLNERMALASLTVHLMRGLLPERKGVQYDVDLWSEYEKLIPLALNTVNYESELSPTAAEEAARVCNSAAVYYRFVVGDFATALVLAEAAVRLAQKVFGLDHKFTTTAMGNQADILGELSRDVEAEALFKSTIQIRQKSLGRYDAALAFSHNNYAEFLKKRGRLDEAVEHFAMAVRIREVNQMHHDRLTIISRSNLAEARARLAARNHDAADLLKAIEDAREALREVEAEAQGDEAGSLPAIALCEEQLATTLILADCVNEAVTYQAQALHVYVELYGANHPEIWEAVERLTSYLDRAGDHASANAIKTGDFSRLSEILRTSSLNYN